MAGDRLLDRRDHLRSRPTDGLRERLRLRVGLGRALERPLGVGHGHPAPGREQLGGHGHPIEQERCERVGPLEAEPVGEPLHPVAEPVGQPRRAALGDREEVVVGQELADRRDLDRAELLRRQLRRRGELPEALDLVAPVLEPRRAPGDAREDVDDPAPDGELATVLHHVHARVAELRESFREGVGCELDAGRELHRPGRAEGRGDRLHRGQVGSHDDERSRRSAETPDRVGPPGCHLRRRIHPLVGQRIPRRQERHAVRTEVRADLGGQVLCLARAGSDDHQRGVQRDRQRRQEGVLSGVDLRDDRSFPLQQDALDGRGAHERIEHIPERHPTSRKREHHNANSPGRVATGHREGF